MIAYGVGDPRPAGVSLPRSDRAASSGDGKATLSSVNSLTYEDLGSAAQRERRRRILDAAMALASKGGFEQMQMRAVAERADVALGTLYRYFPSKIHLLVSVLGQQFEQASQALGAQADPR